MSSRCPYCSKPFREQNALFQHVKAKHPTKKRAHLRPARESEMSLADELIEAKLAFAAGECVPEDLLSMFPDEFVQPQE